MVIAGRLDAVEASSAQTFLDRVGGTVAAPQAAMSITGTDLKVPPGAGGKPIQTVKSIVINGSWRDRTVLASIDATEDRGSLRGSIVANQDSPKDAQQAQEAMGKAQEELDRQNLDGAAQRQTEAAAARSRRSPSKPKRSRSDGRCPLTRASTSTTRFNPRRRSCVPARAGCR